ncbi:transcription antitermination factor NusB [Ectothiorhodospiraceae bacterium WFHF3C12]|nr:transcription antitermination factor NusB [Ectothiorhodospiraceae bacterium WFHF3C12]
MAGQKRHADPRRQRSRARRRAMQALYQWDMASQNLAEIEAQFREEHQLANTDLEYFGELLHQVPARLDELDAELERYLDRALRYLDPVERAILRIGAYELMQRLDVPYRVVINEAVELCKQFGAEQSHRYINGVLDKLACNNTFRAAERSRRDGAGR